MPKLQNWNMIYQVCSSLPTPPPIKDYSNKKDGPDHKQALMQSDNVDFVEPVNL
nr:12709_t:CDS:2 [Entrophospora candida]